MGLFTKKKRKAKRRKKRRARRQVRIPLLPGIALGYSPSTGISLILGFSKYRITICPRRGTITSKVKMGKRGLRYTRTGQLTVRPYKK